MKISLKIRINRHNIGFDQCEMAKKLNITTQQYSRIENSLDELTPEISAQLDQIFGIWVEDFSEV